MKILFPDMEGIAAAEGIELRQGSLRKHGEPLIVPEHPWEDIYTYLYGSVLKRGAMYRMWYQSYVDGGGFFVGYARSRNGIQWEKPLFRKMRFEGPGTYPTVAVGERIEDFYSKRNGRTVYKSNIVSTYHIPSVIYDAGDKRNPYKLFGYTGKGYCVAFSRDGLHFKEYEKNPVLPVMRFPNKNTGKTWFSDVAPVFRDTRRDRFVAHVKTYTVDDEGRTRRCVGYSESKDFINWSRPETIWSPSAAEDELSNRSGFSWADFYGLCGFNYGDGYLGLLWLFLIKREVEKGTHDGKVAVYLAYSRDGKKWSRISDEPLIPLGRSGWDTDMIYTANAPVFLKNRTLVYYGGANFSHGIGHEGFPYEKGHGFKIGIAEMRKDGFVYAYSAEGASFLTKRIEMKKGLVVLNADASRGSMHMDFIRKGKVLESARIRDIDSASHRIRINTKGDITCKVRLNDVRLYSLEAL